jgi:hypothetical protein
MSEETNGKPINESGGGEVTALHDLIAGGVAGSASVVVGHPFDTLKVRLQTSSAGSKGASGGGIRSLFSGMGAPLSTAAVVNAIIFASYGSSTRLWEDAFEGGRHDSDVHGVMVEGGNMLEHGNTGTHEQVKSWKKQQEVPSPLLESEAKQQTFQSNQTESSTSSQNIIKVFTCGSIAGTVQAFVICPMEHIKCRLQVQAAAVANSAKLNQSPASSPKMNNVSANNLAPGSRAFSTAATSSQQTLYKGPIDCGLSIIRNHGLFRGLFRGMGVTLWRETPAFGMYFATYDTIKARVENLLEDKDDHHPIPTHAHAWAASALAGGISGAWTWAIIYPFDVIKSRIQTAPLERHLQKGMWTVARDIVRENGWQYMFRGLGVTLVRAFPVNAIIFPVYEFVLLQLGDGD